MRSTAIAVLVAASGCRGLLGIEEAGILPVGDGGPDSATDARDDAPLVAPDGSVCFGQDLLVICPAILPTATLMFTTNTVIDTTPPASCTQIVSLGSSGSACVIEAQEITIDPFVTVTVRGSRSLVLVATSKITIAGELDFAGNPTAGPNTCPNGAQPGPGGGGAGGSLGTRGGFGGVPSGGQSGVSLSPLAALRGGCPGQSVGIAAGGTPGGGILLIAPMIAVTGRINASGGGGRGGSSLVGGPEGGAGGGSGGVIALDAPTIVLDASSVLLANGGGGGGGAATSLDGTAGLVPDPFSPLTPAAGGPGGGTSGNGGAGSTSTAGELGGSGSVGIAGSGGGGGGGGFIRLRGANIIGSGAVSPPQT